MSEARKLLTHALVFWMALIVFLSCQPHLKIEASAVAREWLHGRDFLGGKPVAAFFHPAWHTLSEKLLAFYGIEYATEGAAFDFLVRKSGHFGVYFVFALLCFACLCSCVRAPFPYTLALGLSLAALDELNQSFHAGRSARLQDVLIDAGGIWCALLIAEIFLFAGGRRVSKRSDG
ncbi:hypothetical protein BSNK01_18350 [Bacillaceae bacterium]